MKIKFNFPFNKTDKTSIVVQEVVKANQKYFLFHKSPHGINFVIANARKIKFIILLVEYQDEYWWANTIPFDLIFKKFPTLNAEKERFEKKGFHKKILEAIFNTMNIRAMLDEMNPETLRKFILKDYKEVDDA